MTGQYVAAADPPEQRFAASHTHGEPDDCWTWLAGKTGHGYGAFYPGDGKQWGAHVWAYVQAHGAVPAGLVVDHHCHNRACVNPSHLRLLTRGGNVMADNSEAHAARNQRKTHCIRGHELAGENLIITPNFRNPARPPWRSCRACAAARKREKRATARA